MGFGAGDVVGRIADDPCARRVGVAGVEITVAQERDTGQVVACGRIVRRVVAPDVDVEAVGVDACGGEFDAPGIGEVAGEEADGEAVDGKEGLEELGDAGAGLGGVLLGEEAREVRAVAGVEGVDRVGCCGLIVGGEEVGDDEGVEAAGVLDGVLVEVIAELFAAGAAHGGDAEAGCGDERSVDIEEDEHGGGSLCAGLSADVEVGELVGRCGKPVGSAVDEVTDGVGDCRVEFVDFFRGAFGDEVDGAVGLIPDESGDAQWLRESPGCGSEADALNPTREDRLASCVAHDLGAGWYARAGFGFVSMKK